MDAEETGKNNLKELILRNETGESWVEQMR